MSNKNQTIEPEEQALALFQPKTALAKLPDHLQKALAKFRTREQAGFAPQWKPTTKGQYIIGTVMSVRDDVETEFGLASIVTFQTPDGPVAVFLGTELRRKLADAQKDQAYVVQYDGIITKKDNPKIKNDMKTYTVIEVLPPEA